MYYVVLNITISFKFFFGNILWKTLLDCVHRYNMQNSGEKAFPLRIFYFSSKKVPKFGTRIYYYSLRFSLIRIKSPRKFYLRESCYGNLTHLFESTDFYCFSISGHVFIPLISITLSFSGCRKKQMSSYDPALINEKLDYIWFIWMF